MCAVRNIFVPVMEYLSSRPYACHEGVWGEWGMASLILKLGAVWVSGQFHSSAAISHENDSSVPAEQ